MCAYVPAKAELIGELRRSATTNVFTITNLSPLRAAVTISYLDERGVDLIMFETVPPAQEGNGTTINISLPRFKQNIKRIVLEIDVPPSGWAEIMINGAAPLCVGNCEGSHVTTGRIVFDVVDLTRSTRAVPAAVAQAPQA
jgi:hypothetical protein